MSALQQQHRLEPGMGGHSDADTTVIDVNVGGTIYATTLGTLRTHRASILAHLFTFPYSAHSEVRSIGPNGATRLSFFIDRNGPAFGALLDYLRTGSLIVPRDAVAYAVLRREALFYGLPIAAQLPAARPLLWEAAPVRYRHARIVVDALEKSVEWEEGAVPPGLYQHSLSEIVAFFAARGYKMVAEYASRGSTGLVSVWLRKKECFPGADVPLEVRDEPGAVDAGRARVAAAAAGASGVAAASSTARAWLRNTP